ncbi:7 transmembrane receptor [Trichuris suis]|nr:7 transmembrane receptor [Trichuris suis]
MISNTNATNGSSSSFCVYSQTMGMHHQIWAKILFILLYTFVFLMAFCGNLLVVYIILMRRRLQNVTNFFICNLAVSDLFVSLTSLWLTPMYGYLGRWVWGNFMCHSVPMIQGAGIFISSLTLTAIAVDRYIVILNPFKKRMTVKVCLTIIISIWLFSLMLVAPYGLHMELHYSQQCDYHVCRELWEFGELQAAYGFTVMALQFGIPFFIIAICYIRIWHSLSSRKTLVHLKSDSALNRKKRLLKVTDSQVL